MLKFMVAALTLSLVLISGARADEYVNGYFRKNGTYVQPYYRSSPDNSYNNNWSVSPNINPYTGQMGTRSPTFDDQAPSYGNGSGGGSYYQNWNNSGSGDDVNDDGE